MADAEKTQLPTIVQPPPEYTRTMLPSRLQNVKKSTIALTAYAAAVTAFLVAMAIFGGIMYQRTLRDCDAKATAKTTEVATSPQNLKSKTVQYTEDGKKVTEDVMNDYEKEVTVYRVRDSGAVVVLDFRRSMTGIYDPESKECYMIGGVNHNLKKPLLGSDDDQDDEDHETEELNYRRADDYPVLDSSVLPQYLRPYCEDRKVYWLERTAEKEESGRQKRAWCFRVCVRVGWFRICYWRCW